MCVCLKSKIENCRIENQQSRLFLSQHDKHENLYVLEYLILWLVLIVVITVVHPV